MLEEYVMPVKNEVARLVTFSSSKVKQIKVRYPFRDLKNYKEMHKGTAKAKGCSDVFEASRTLTVARKILFG